MNPGLKSSTILPALTAVLYLAFFTGLAFSFRAVASISIGLILVTGIVRYRIEHDSFFKTAVLNLFTAGCALFFLLQFIALLYTHNTHEEWNHIRLKSALVIVPLAIFYTGNIKIVTRRKLFSAFCMILAVASFYCLCLACREYIRSHEISFFFYHKLVKPLSHNAVQFSVLVFMALVYLSESAKRGDFIVNKAFHYFLTAFFSVLIFLLSSKLVIAFYLLYLLYFFIHLTKNKRITHTVTITFFLLLVAVVSVFIIRNPISDRFYELTAGNMKIIQQEKFDKGDYFNGIQFRLLQFRFTKEILTENQAWWSGVSPGDAQALHDQKYIVKNMYTGDPATGDRGFLGYNTHNQFLEALLQSGIPGFFIFVVICFSLLQMAWKKRNSGFSFIVLLLLAYSISESVFETQYGLLLFLFFPLFFYPNDDKKTMST